MTPTDSAENVVAEWRAAMEGVTPGPWSANSTEPPGDWCVHAKGVPWQLAYLAWSSMVDWPLERNAAWIARCSPSGISGLLDLIESQRAELARLTDGEILDMRMASGAIDLSVTSKALEHLALVLTEHFRESGAKNYIELSLHAKTEPFESYVVTVQKRNGAKTPHELRQAAEARVTALEAEKGGFQWFDIESAPKSGVSILVCGCSYGPAVRIAHWGNGRFLGRKKGYEQGWSHVPGHTCDPKFWAPIPMALSRSTEVKP